jgi:hypothetical protein
MKRRNPILTFISIVLVFFLFTPVLIRTLNVSSGPILKQVSVSATSGTPSKLDTQLPFEEREKEEEAATHSIASLPLLAVLPEPILFLQSVNLKFQPRQVSLKCEHQPKYIIIRSLLI